jgi:phosphonate transport system substrate-binding protein
LAEFINGIPWQERESLLDAGRIHVAWICGLPYVWKADRPRPHIELLAGPVMQDASYEDRPVYFSDVVVRRDSESTTFADLRGASWAYDEPGSYSGYNVVRYHCDPAIRPRIRILERLGPSPMPPWVVLRSLSPDLRNSLRAALLGMHRDPQGRVVVVEGHRARFAPVTNADYDAIRHLARLAAPVIL